MTDQVQFDDTQTIIEDNPSPSPDEHQTADIPPAPSQVAERPENVPEKFWNAETGEINTAALLESNRHLESKFTKQQQATGDEITPAETGLPDIEAAPEGSGPAIQSAIDEWRESESLSEAMYVTLDDVGIPREVVDAYIDGQTARADVVFQAAYVEAGGTAESYGEMSEWAANNLSQQELDAYNVQIEGDSTWQFAIQSMYARFRAEGPLETPLINGSGNSGASVAGFRNTQEMQAAMDSKLYKTDAAYRKEVEQKIVAAERQGVKLFG